MSKKWNIGQPGGPSGPYYSVLKPNGNIVALYVPNRETAELIAVIPELQDLADKGQQLSMWAASIHWDGSRNTPELVSFIGADWYILVEPSIHPTGDRYEWIISPFTTPFAEVRDREALGLDLSQLDWEADNYFDNPYAEYEDDDLDLY